MGRIGLVGGGVVGLCTGLDLLDAGHRVTLMDNDDAGQAASWGNAGHIAVEQVEPLASCDMVRSLPKRLFLRGGPLAFPPGAAGAWMPFGLRLLSAARPSRFRQGCDALCALLGQSMPAWEHMVAGIGQPDLLRQDGHYVLWHEGRAAEAGRAGWRQADTGTAQVHDASAAEIARLQALCGQPLAGAIRFSGSGQIADLDRLRASLRSAFMARGGVLVQGAATILRQGDRAQLAGLDVDQIILCAGVRSRGLMEAIGHKVPMIAERGYHIRADASGWPVEMPPLVFEERAMIVTRYATQVQAASFVELNHVDAPADPRKWERLERHVAELGLPIAGPFQRWMGCRPTLPDYLPAIGRSAITPNLCYAFGHQHLGLTLAPITARLMTALVAGDRPELPVEAFDIQRFA